MIVGAFAASVMVASVFPFLSVLADPNIINRNAVLASIFRALNFESNYSFLVFLGIIAIAVILLANLVLVLQTWSLARYSEMRVHSISRKLLSHYLAQPYESFLGQHTGDMSTNILSEAYLLVQQFLRPLAELISASLTVVAIVLTVIVIDPLVSSIAIITIGAVYGMVAILSRRYVQLMGKRRAQANALRFRIAGEALGGIKDVKLLGRELTYLDRFSAQSELMAKAQIGVNVVAQSPRYAIQIVGFGGIVALCLVLLDPEGLQDRQALGGILPLVGLLAFAGQRLLPELHRLYYSLTMMTSGTAALDSVYNVLANGQEVTQAPSTSPTHGLRNSLELNSVSYVYPNAKRAGLKDITLTITAGERIGIVGPSGAGKTTLADVLLGLLKPQTGTLRADGIQIESGNMRAWQRSVGYVPQDIFLTDASLSENIALGLRPAEIDAKKVERAARIAQLHNFIEAELPQGYATLIGERGVRLSGGQRQRIGIARALYNDADLIVFDEATSALDNLTEREVIAAIEALPGEKTIMMVAHRLSTVKVCDRILFLENGRVAGIGTWDELVVSNSSFRDLSSV